MSISTISFQLVQIHVILIAFTLPKWMQATASNCKRMSITLANRIFQLTLWHILKVLSTHSKSKLFQWLPFSSNIFSYSSPLHFQWNHPCISPFECIRACTCLSNHSLFLWKHSPSTPQALPTHSYCLEITPSLAISLSPFLRPHTPSTTRDRLCR